MAMSVLIKYIVKQKYVFVDILKSHDIIVLLHCVRGVQRGYVIAHTSERKRKLCCQCQDISFVTGHELFIFLHQEK